MGGITPGSADANPPARESIQLGPQIPVFRRIRINLFIPTPVARPCLLTGADVRCPVGNNRSFMPGAGVLESKVSFDLDFVSGVHRFQVNQTCWISGRLYGSAEYMQCFSPLPTNFYNVLPGANGSSIPPSGPDVNHAYFRVEGSRVSLCYHAKLAGSGIYNSVSPAIDGSLGFDMSKPGIQPWRNRDGYPSIEVYHERFVPGQDYQQYLVSRKSPRSLPLYGLPSFMHQDVEGAIPAQQLVGPPGSQCAL